MDGQGQGRWLQHGDKFCPSKKSQCPQERLWELLGDVGFPCGVTELCLLSAQSATDFLLLCGSGILHPPSPCSASPGAPHLDF